MISQMQVLLKKNTKRQFYFQVYQSQIHKKKVCILSSSPLINF